MIIIENSKTLELSENPNLSGDTTDIHVIMQFFVHSSNIRNNEIQVSLQKNFINSNITKLHLLNERIYSDKELGLQSTSKIHQENIGKRLSFQDVFSYIRSNNLKGYFVFINADIFLDDTINFIRTSTMHEKKQMCALLRFEYDPAIALDDAKLFGPRADSQDTWIFHSNFLPKQEQEKCFAFNFGQPGCDNKIIYLMRILGYQIFNDPHIIKTYHYHLSKERNYTNKDMVNKPWGFINPNNVNLNNIARFNANFTPMTQIYQYTKGFSETVFDDNKLIFDFIRTQNVLGKHFIIPRIAGIENNFAVFGKFMKDTGNQKVQEYFNNVRPTMKSNAGIKLSNNESILKYSEMYLKAFENSELFFGWEIYGDVFKHISETHGFIKQLNVNKKMGWAFALDIFHYIYNTPWTHALQGKRILIISAFEESIREKIAIREKIYDGVDLFPDCEFVFIKPPITQSDEPSREFDVELKCFTDRLDTIKDDYDVALVSCGGYGNLVCNHIFENHQKSAIYVGGVLQVYFGILGNRWLIERPDVVRLFMNEHWSRPKVSERPKGCEKIEKGCYW
jgi:hypothetical protein